MEQNESFGYEGCTLTVETSDIDNKVTFAPLERMKSKLTQ